MPAPTVAALLDAARDLVARRYFDVEQVLQLLSLLTHLPIDELDLQTRGAVKHAEMTGAAALKGGPGLTAVSRVALARVVVLLEKHVES